MTATRPRLAGPMLTALLLCALVPAQAFEPGFGPLPDLAAPESSLLPTINVAKAVGWKSGELPIAAKGLKVKAFAQDLDHPRWLYVLPNGDVLVAESQAPPKTAGGGLRNWIEKKVMQRAGAGTRPSADRISLLRDVDGDGVAEIRSVFLNNLTSPIGMALIGERFYVANADSVMVFAYRPDAMNIRGEGKKLIDLPAGAINYHWTKSMIASADGAKLFVGVGSNSNIAEHGMALEHGRAAIWEIDGVTGAHRIYASGLRNPVGLAFEPNTGVLWAAVNERDGLGNDLVPDYITSVRDSGFYGWPWHYFGKYTDARVSSPAPENVGEILVPDYAVGAHTASLGLAAARGNALTAAFAEGMFVGQHGSWNRESASGYKVIFVPFTNGQPSGEPVDVVNGFLDQDGHARGRPTGLALDRKGALLVADDVGNTIWRVSRSMASKEVKTTPRASQNH